MLTFVKCLSESHRWFSTLPGNLFQLTVKYTSLKPYKQPNTCPIPCIQCHYGHWLTKQECPDHNLPHTIISKAYFSFKLSICSMWGLFYLQCEDWDWSLKISWENEEDGRPTGEGRAAGLRRNEKFRAPQVEKKSDERERECYLL